MKAPGQNPSLKKPPVLRALLSAAGLAAVLLLAFQWLVAGISGAAMGGVIVAMALGYYIIALLGYWIAWGPWAGIMPVIHRYPLIFSLAGMLAVGGLATLALALLMPGIVRGEAWFYYFLITGTPALMGSAAGWYVLHR